MKLQLEIVGELPKGILPTIIKVEPQMGTFELQNDRDILATGQMKVNIK